MHEKKHRIPTHVLYKIFIYVALIALAISIIVPVAWVFMASLKKNAEFIGADVNPWALPKQFYYQNFVVAFQDARMGDFFLNSFIVTALALALLLILALPASYVLARFKFRGKKFFSPIASVPFSSINVYAIIYSFQNVRKLNIITDRRYDTWWTQRIGGDKNARKDSNFDHGCCFCCLPRPDHDRTEKYRRAGTDYGTGRTGRLADTLVYLQQ